MRIFSFYLAAYIFSMYLYIYLFIYLYIFVYTYLVYIYIHLHIYIYIFIYHHLSVPGPVFSDVLSPCFLPALFGP